MVFNAVLIVDVHSLLQEARRSGHPIDPVREAQGLSVLLGVFGRRSWKVAIVPNEELEVQRAYQHAGFDIRTGGVNQAQDLLSLTAPKDHNLHLEPMERLIIVSNDPTFLQMCLQAIDVGINVDVWLPGKASLPELDNLGIKSRLLEELLPETKSKVPSVGIYLDYENLHIGLEQKGINPEPEALINAVRAETADLGNIAEIAAYADWSEISKNSRRDAQRELALLQVRTVYQINRYGKNSADMAMADDIRTRMERGSGAPEAIDILAIGTQDRDFSSLIRTAKAAGKKVILLGLKDGMSRDLAQLAEVRYIDRHLEKQISDRVLSLNSEDMFSLLMQIANYLYENGWSWTYITRLIKSATFTQEEQTLLEEAINSGLLIQANRPGTLKLNLENPDAFTASWLVGRLNYLLRVKRMGYVDTNYLARGMKMDKQMQRFGIGQTFHQALRILERASATGYIIRIKIIHPKNASEMIDTWWPLSLQQGQKCYPKLSTLNTMVRGSIKPFTRHRENPVLFTREEHTRQFAY